MLSCVQKVLHFMKKDQTSSKSSIICLLTFNLIVFEQMKRFVFPPNFGFSAFLLGRDKIIHTKGDFAKSEMSFIKYAQIRIPTF